MNSVLIQHVHIAMMSLILQLLSDLLASHSSELLSTFFVVVRLFQIFFLLISMVWLVFVVFSS